MTSLQQAVCCIWKTTLTNPLNLSARIDVTGRDYSILVKALAYAITTIDSLPSIRQEGSDRDDMLLLLTAMVPNEKWRRMEIMTARRHMGLEPFFVEPQDHQRHLN